MFYPAELLLKIAEKKARDAQAESGDARSSTSLLEDGDVEAMGKVDAQGEGDSKGRHADLEAVVRGLRKELRGKDERLKEKEEEIERLTMAESVAQERQVELGQLAAELKRKEGELRKQESELESLRGEVSQLRQRCARGGGLEGMK